MRSTACWRVPRGSPPSRLSLTGPLLDHTLDYLNYVFVPAFVMYRADLFPADAALVGAAVVCLSSAYQFCHTSAKTDDHFF